MSRLQAHLKQACLEFQLVADIGAKIQLSSGAAVDSVAIVRRSGDAHGIVVVDSLDAIAAAADELVALGYGYSVLSEPAPAEAYDPTTYLEMFTDWGLMDPHGTSRSN